MGELEDKFHEVEINFTAGPSPDFLFKVDGKKFEHTCGIVIKSALAAGGQYPVVTVSFFARSVTGRVKGMVVEEKPF
jgi:hypothetical protein